MRDVVPRLDVAELQAFKTAVSGLIVAARNVSSLLRNTDIIMVDQTRAALAEQLDKAAARLEVPRG